MMIGIGRSSPAVVAAIGAIVAAAPASKIHRRYFVITMTTGHFLQEHRHYPVG
jgi:hypothetical protein